MVEATPDTPTEKRCGACGFTKPAGDFHVAATKADGLQSWCKECLTTRNRNNRKRARAAVLARAAVRARQQPATA